MLIATPLTTINFQKGKILRVKEAENRDHTITIGSNPPVSLYYVKKFEFVENPEAEIPLVSTGYGCVKELTAHGYIVDLGNGTQMLLHPDFNDRHDVKIGDVLHVISSKPSQTMIDVTTPKSFLQLIKEIQERGRVKAAEILGESEILSFIDAFNAQNPHNPITLKSTKKQNLLNITRFNKVNLTK